MVVERALEAFIAEGIAPSLCVVRPGAGPQVFDQALADAGFAPHPREGVRLYATTAEGAVTFLALRRHRTLAYNLAQGLPEDHRAAARTLVDALAPRRAWLNSSVLEVVRPQTLDFPPTGAIERSFQLSDATFEELLVLQGASHSLLALWTCED